MMEVKTVILFLCFFTYLHSGESLYCYQCSSVDEPSCHNNVTDLYKTECNETLIKGFINDLKESFRQSTPSEYEKLSQSELNDDSYSLSCITTAASDPETPGDVTVVRKCDTDKIFSQDKCAFLIKQHKSSPVQHLNVFCNHCESDLCNKLSIFNSSSSLHGSLVFLLLSTIAPILKHYTLC
ncbi:uncharacterized protein LOC142334176 [Lycorma delicatula]|uniref:uncharacterized protein LOC142334176 n=1 Tax=Lycorma delicatula TaxID=130591 RepID=UPI003F512858